MENKFFSKVIELSVTNFIKSNNFDVDSTKSLINELRQFVKLADESTENLKPRRIRRKKDEEDNTSKDQ